MATRMGKAVARLNETIHELNGFDYIDIFGDPDDVKVGEVKATMRLVLKMEKVAHKAARAAQTLLVEIADEKAKAKAAKAEAKAAKAKAATKAAPVEDELDEDDAE